MKHQMHVTLVIKNKKAFNTLKENIELLKDIQESYPWDDNVKKLIENFEYLAKNLQCTA